MPLNLIGTVAVVTGASSGIGRATAIRLAQQGASVALIARREERLRELEAEITREGGKATAVAADITDRTQAADAIATIVQKHGRVDILINNAGVMLLGPIVDADPAEWERMLDVNVRGLLNVTHAALPHLLEAAEAEPRRVADIVNISSVAGRVAGKDFGVYNLTKFGVNGFTESLRKEVTQRHVRVGVLEPGEVATELVSHNTDRIKAQLAETKNPAPLNPDDIADGVTYMVTRPRHTTIGELWVMPTTEV